ncbi:MAG: M48 family metalloprotease [Bacteroidota bacterium]
MKYPISKGSYVLLFCFFPFFLMGSPLTNADIQSIFSELTVAVGDKSRTLPKVVVRQEKRFGASYKRSENTIFIEQTAIDICNTLGEDAKSAVAFLLGHELTHYYQKHDWQEAGFTTGFLTNAAIFQKHIHHEREADTYSAFITHLAGYNSIKILPELLDKIYQAYGLVGKELRSYPTLAERKAVANEVCKTVQGLIDIYQVGNYLYALGKYEEALVSYEYLLKYVRYKELYNNIGLCALYAALPATRRDFPFDYPLTLDTNVPLRAPSSFTKDELLQKAIYHFAEATTYDASYFVSYLNLVCAYDLAGEFDKVDPLLRSLKKIAFQAEEQQQLNLLEGIQAFRRQQKEVALDYFSRVATNPTFPKLADLANTNLQIVQGQKVQRKAGYQPPRLADKIDGINLLFYENEAADNFLLRDEPLHQQSVLIHSLKSSKIYLFKSNEQVTKIQFTKAPNARTSHNIGIGSSIRQIEVAYPNTEKRLVAHTNGVYLLLEAKGLLFNLDKQNRVLEWCVFIN